MCWPLAKTNQPGRVFPPAVAKCSYVLPLDESASMTGLQFHLFSVTTSVSQPQCHNLNVTASVAHQSVDTRLPNQIIIANPAIDKSFDKISISSLASPLARRAFYWRGLSRYERMLKYSCQLDVQAFGHLGAAGGHFESVRKALAKQC